MFQILLANGELEKGLCYQRESHKNDHPSPPLALILQAMTPAEDTWADIQKASDRNKHQGFVFI